MARQLELVVRAVLQAVTMPAQLVTLQALTGCREGQQVRV